jgi:type II secretory pathway pseudopilin PulG
MSVPRRRPIARDREAGLTLVELLVAAAMSVVIVGAATSMLISAVQSQPKLSKKAQEISTARYVLERMTREIRNGIQVFSASGSQVEFETRLRRTECGGTVLADESAPSIRCRVTYSCTTTACTRAETDPETPGSGGTPTVLVSGLDNSNVFNYEPNLEEPSYVGITLHIENPEGRGELTVTDGAGLRIQSYLG